ncbi:hypothetical protein [Gemella morbillorum]|uniref:hypothetical protein n=1 Tax=Gemella morbillorum TaxID=29391 RepID=UPI0023F1438D|nr:hypothetical protein [Gemella morbillorum]
MSKNNNELIEELKKQTVETNRNYSSNTFRENLIDSYKKFFEDKNIYDNIEDIHKEHIKKLSDLVIEELQQKQNLRKISMRIAIISLIIFGIAIVGLYVTLLCRNVLFSDKLLIGITVTMFTAILGLVTIIFKYSFSRTKEVTDYLKDSYVDIKKKDNDK